MWMNLKRKAGFLSILLAILLAFAGCEATTDAVIEQPLIIEQTSESEQLTLTEKTQEEEVETVPEAEVVSEELPDRDGVYTTAEDVALYIHTYHELPGNFMTKKEAKKLGWEGGSLEDYAPGKCIGGDYFGNYEGNLPEKEGREYHECDIDTLGAKKRGAKRLIYSNDGLIYYTEDHYETFTLLYGEE